MRRVRGFVLACVALIAPLALAQSVAVTSRGVIVAHDRVIELFDANTLKSLWKVEGVDDPGEIVVDNDCCQVAVLDPVANSAAIVDVQSGKATVINTGETPTGGIYIDHQLYILERDARALERIGADGARASIKTGAGPQLLAVSGKDLVVYSAVTGGLQVIDTATFTVAREMKVAAFASAMVADDKYAYLVYPYRAVLGFVDLVKMEYAGDGKAGSLPMDLKIVNHPTILTARTMAIADQTGNRVIQFEGRQGASEAFVRGFLRGAIGLRLYGGAAKMPAGVDRLASHSAHWVAYDSFNGALYRARLRRVDELAKGIGPRSFAIGDDAVYVWQNGTLVAQK